MFSNKRSAPKGSDSNSDEDNNDKKRPKPSAPSVATAKKAVAAKSSPSAPPGASAASGASAKPKTNVRKSIINKPVRKKHADSSGDSDNEDPQIWWRALRDDEDPHEIKPRDPSNQSLDLQGAVRSGTGQKSRFLPITRSRKIAAAWSLKDAKKDAVGRIARLGFNNKRDKQPVDINDPLQQLKYFAKTPSKPPDKKPSRSPALNYALASQEGSLERQTYPEELLGTYEVRGISDAEYEKERAQGFFPARGRNLRESAPFPFSIRPTFINPFSDKETYKHYEKLYDDIPDKKTLLKDAAGAYKERLRAAITEKKFDRSLLNDEFPPQSAIRRKREHEARLEKSGRKDGEIGAKHGIPPPDTSKVRNKAERKQIEQEYVKKVMAAEESNPTSSSSASLAALAPTSSSSHSFSSSSSSSSPSALRSFSSVSAGATPLSSLIPSNYQYMPAESLSSSSSSLSDIGSAFSSFLNSGSPSAPYSSSSSSSSYAPGPGPMSSFSSSSLPSQSSSSSSSSSSLSPYPLQGPPSLAQGGYVHYSEGGYVPEYLSAYLRDMGY